MDQQLLVRRRTPFPQRSFSSVLAAAAVGSTFGLIGMVLWSTGASCVAVRSGVDECSMVVLGMTFTSAAGFGGALAIVVSAVVLAALRLAAVPRR